MKKILTVFFQHEICFLEKNTRLLIMISYIKESIFCRGQFFSIRYISCDEIQWFFYLQPSSLL